jgi:hypothetical protein
MWEFIKRRLYRVTVFLLIGLVAAGTALLVKCVASWFHYSPVQREALGKAVFDHVTYGLVAACFVLGVLALARQLRAELRGRTKPPPLPSFRRSSRPGGARDGHDKS